VLGAETDPTTSQAPTTEAGPVTVRQILNELLAQATQQLTAALPNWAAMPNGVAQLQALLQDALTHAEAQRPGITTRPSSQLARQRALPIGVVCRSAGGVRSRGAQSHAVAVPGRARCQGNAGKEAEPASSPHEDPAE
jgi:hypothetical protein